MQAKGLSSEYESGLNFLVFLWDVGAVARQHGGRTEAENLAWPVTAAIVASSISIRRSVALANGEIRMGEVDIVRNFPRASSEAPAVSGAQNDRCVRQREKATTIHVFCAKASFAVVTALRVISMT